MTWHSGEDILKDLAVLDDFDAFKDEGSSNFLYSIGRGAMTSEAKYSNVFIDPRTGEAVKVVDEYLDDDNEICYKTKGRGSIIGFNCRAKSQLQKQLRLARPLGSSDEVIESYCRRNELLRTNENSAGASDWELLPQKFAADTKNCDSKINFKKDPSRVKATRNSKLQHNALISHLLSSKSTVTSEQNLVKERKDFSHIKEGNCFQKSNLVCNDNFIDYESGNDDEDDAVSSVSSSDSHKFKNEIVQNQMVKNMN